MKKEFCDVFALSCLEGQRHPLIKDKRYKVDMQNGENLCAHCNWTRKSISGVYVNVTRKIKDDYIHIEISLDISRDTPLYRGKYICSLGKERCIKCGGDEYIKVLFKRANVLVAGSGIIR